MNKQTSASSLIGHRAELMAELYLQSLGPAFLVRPKGVLDFEFDLFVGFDNTRGGYNITAIQLKATEQHVPHSFPVKARVLRHLANSNVAGLLLIMNVKQNRMYYVWPTPDLTANVSFGTTIRIPVTELTDQTRMAFWQRLKGTSEDA